MNFRGGKFGAAGAKSGTLGEVKHTILTPLALFWGGKIGQKWVLALPWGGKLGVVSALALSLALSWGGKVGRSWALALTWAGPTCWWGR